jgi:cytochrome c-type biogenesis protein
VFFVLGFSTVFIVLGLAVSAIGEFLYNTRDILSKLGGVIVILFGLHMTGLLKIPFLNYDLRPRSKNERNRSFISSFLMGVFFSAGWSPCVGPVLGAILMLALNEGSLVSGFWLLTSYSAGMAIPFLAAAAATGWVTHLLRKFRNLMHYIEIAMGVMLIVVGVLLFLGIFEQLAGLGSFINLGL